MCTHTWGGGYNWKFALKISPEPIMRKDVEENLKKKNSTKLPSYNSYFY